MVQLVAEPGDAAAVDGDLGDQAAGSFLGPQLTRQGQSPLLQELRDLLAGTSVDSANGESTTGHRRLDRGTAGDEGSGNGTAGRDAVGSSEDEDTVEYLALSVVGQLSGRGQVDRVGKGDPARQ